MSFPQNDISLCNKVSISLNSLLEHNEVQIHIFLGTVPELSGLEKLKLFRLGHK